MHPGSMATLYRSDTREAQYPSVPAPLRAALARWAEAHQLTLDGARVWLTRSENLPAEGVIAKLLGRRKNPADPDAESVSALLLHPTQVIVGSYGERAGANVTGVALAQLSVQRGNSLAAKLGPAAPQDDGISLDGVPSGTNRVATLFFKMGGADADGCFAAVESAVRAAKRG